MAYDYEYQEPIIEAKLVERYEDGVPAETVVQMKIQNTQYIQKFYVNCALNMDEARDLLSRLSAAIKRAES